MTQSQSTVFVVDDDEMVRDSLKALLESRSFHVVDFVSGKQFLDQANGADNCCLVLDVHMSEMTGIELLRLLRNRGDAIPTILITGRTDPAVQAQAKELGVVALLDKPIAHPALFAAIRQALTSRP